MATLSREALVGQLGINLIERRTLEMGFRWEPTKALDLGIDGLIEICDPETGEATNRIILVQSKAGQSFFRSEDEASFSLYLRHRDLTYWRRGQTPVIVVVSRPDLDEAYWTPISKQHAMDLPEGESVRIQKQEQRFERQAAAGLAALAASVERRLVELILDRPIWDLTELEEARLLEFISSLEETSIVRLVYKGYGSVRLVLDLSASHARKVLAAFQEELLAEFSVSSARLIAIASLKHTLGEPIKVDTAIAYRPRDERLALEYAERVANEGLSVRLMMLPREGERDHVGDRLLFSHAAIVLIGRDGVEPWLTSELASGVLGEMATQGVRLLPTFLEGAPSDLRIPHFWRALSSFSFRQGFNAPEFARLTRSISYLRQSVDLDLVLCIDTTASMNPILEHVKNEIRILVNRLQLLTAEGTGIGVLRVRIIQFRDVYDNPRDAFTASEFLELPRENATCQDIIDSMQPGGGGDNPENGLEAIVFAMRSNWASPQPHCRRIIVALSDAEAHPLGGDAQHPVTSDYPSAMPVGLSEMQREWTALCATDVDDTGLVLITPTRDPWTTMSQWAQVTHIELDPRAVRNIGVLSEAMIRQIV